MKDVSHIVTKNQPGQANFASTRDRTRLGFIVGVMGAGTLTLLSAAPTQALWILLCAALMGAMIVASRGAGFGSSLMTEPCANNG
jgi:hypothetical protein